MERGPEHESVNFLLGVIGRLQRTQMNEALTAVGVYAGQEMFLWHLWREDGLTQSQLVERLCVQPPTVSKMLERMERTGLVTRRPDPDDSRASRVYLTEPGRKSQHAVGEVWKAIEQRLTAGMSLEERLLLRRLLLQVYANLTHKP
jgi:MarR family transcriptional regulator, organic hydroperoxide resistance regulator